ncbi:putative serine protease PepD [Micromonospora pisi]|uniref:Putative serine protease PepD n=1 Tax=Micromonospora pisi TaxID=589240 RepID=A0A495JH33_9ACTN|nr:trypsin-like peptidase domain-containing protein [Micromonospora pisi]RKR88207.1 putative serine protease PepD [Micromonospora pisi]
MNEYETDPQRPSANADADATPSYPTAELSPVERGPADSTTASGAPAASEPATAGDPDQAGTPAATAEPQSPYASPTTGVPADSSGATTDPYAGTGHPGTPAGPYAGHPGQPGPYAGSYGAPQSGAPAHPTPNPYPPSPWHPAAQNQPGWTGNPTYAGHHPHGAHMPPQPPQVGGNPPPIWAQGPGVPGPAPRPSRAGKFAAIGAAALVLMAGSGIAGGAVALALDGGSSGPSRTYTAAPIINSEDLPKIAASVENSVVSITTGTGEGSGVVLTADGYVLTNNHVVASASGDTVRVVLANGKTAQAKIIGTDPKTDLAVVKAQGVSDLNPAKFGDSDAMQVGDTVLALGSPLGLQGSVTAGIISARDRTIQAGGEDEQQQNPFQQQQPQAAASSISGLLQTDAPINPGNSGGALINTKGEVIGINTAIATAGSNGNIGVGFAIPSNKAKDVASKLQQGQKVSHPYLGVSVTESENVGAVVNGVTQGSPAAQAGLQQGDVITRFGDKTVNDSNDLVGAVQTGKVGDKVQLTFTRNGVEQTATVTLAETS